jgi:GWxTD domain-containing protein
VHAPVVVGQIRPLILAPVGLLTRLPPGQIEAILLHEFAHIRRCDYVVNLAQRWIEGLFFYNPAMWWISRVVRSEREACCDELAAAACGSPVVYARALAALEASRMGSEGEPALAATGGSLRVRIERLLRQSPPSAARGVVSLLTIIAAASALAYAGWQTTESGAALTANQAPAGVPSAPATAQPPLLAQANPDTARTVPPADAASSAYQKWLNEDVVYLISDVERETFHRLSTDEERQMFIEQFWQRREALRPPGAPRSAREEHYRRISYANARFASGIPGWRTDRGRIYITQGPPAEIESHPSGHAGSPPFEIWRYREIAGGRAAQSFTFADIDNTGEYRLQTPETSPPLVFNRIVRWTVVDPMNRFVTGLRQEHFELRENGAAKLMTYFEAPGSPTAVAVVSDHDLPELSTIPLSGPLIQTRTVQDAVARLQSAAAVRRALVIVRGAAATSAVPVPGGIQGVIADASAVARTVIEIANQYVAGYRSDFPAVPDLMVKSVPGLPPLRIGESSVR